MVSRPLLSFALPGFQIGCWQNADYTGIWRWWWTFTILNIIIYFHEVWIFPGQIRPFSRFFSSVAIFSSFFSIIAIFNSLFNIIAAIFNTNCSRPSKASYGKSHMFLAQKLHFVILISNLLQKNFLRLIWRPFEAILSFKSLFEGVQRGLKCSYFVWRAKSSSNQNSNQLGCFLKSYDTYELGLFAEETVIGRDQL